MFAGVEGSEYLRRLCDQVTLKQHCFTVRLKRIDMINKIHIYDRVNGRKFLYLKYIDNIHVYI